MPITQPDFDALIREALDEPVSGWAFPFLDGRKTSDGLTWDYSELARVLVHEADAVLDHGTGGGEVLAGLGRPHGRMIATEAYARNVPVARRTPGPLGVDVVQVSEQTFDTRGPTAEHPDRRMPFDDASFDLVLARNVAFSSTEILRILRPGGHFLTEMGRAGAPRPGEVRLSHHFPDVKTNDWPAWSLLDHLNGAGFVIEEYREQLGRTHFHDIGALVYFLRTVPWARSQTSPSTLTATGSSTCTPTSVPTAALSPRRPRFWPMRQSWSSHPAARWAPPYGTPLSRPPHEIPPRSGLSARLSTRVGSDTESRR